jgi:phage tail sheath protein FI
MPINPTYPGLYIEELPSTSHAIIAAPTSITVFIGYVHPFQGECHDQSLWGEAIRIFNFSDYQRVFGGLFRSGILDTSVAYAVNQFFLNGGADAYVVGLQPKYYDLATTNEATIDPAALDFAGITFTAKQVTDITDMTVTIGSIRQTISAADTADIVITYGSTVEAYRGVQLAATIGTDPNPNFIDTRLAKSELVGVKPTTSPYPASFVVTGSPTQSLPAMTAPYATFTTFKATPFDAVFAADSSLDKVDIFNILCVPGVADTGVWGNALSFCHDKRAMFIIDAPNGVSADGAGVGLPLIEDFAKSGNVPTAFPNAALYFPYLKSADPISGDIIHLPPSGFVAGLYARTDNGRGVWKAPAGLETTIANTNGVVDEGRMTDMRQGTLNPIGVNVIRQFPGGATVIWGARTTVANITAFEQWKYVPVRRTALFLEQSLLRNLGWVVFEPNDEPLWSAIRLSIENFMLSLFRQGAFQGSTPSEAFLVKCDSTTTTQTDIDAGIVNILVGFRPLKPAEFVIIKIAQLAGQVQA